jgi:hypothetical protein
MGALDNEESLSTQTDYEFFLWLDDEVHTQQLMFFIE